MFSTIASGSGPLAFTWTKNGAVISGQASPSLTLSNVTTADAGTYTVAVRGSCSGVTNSATLTVNSPVVIINGLTNVTRCDCDPLVLSPVVSGTGPLTYLWRKNGSVLPGATGDTLAFPKLGTNDAGLYTVEVSGVCNTASRSATITVVKVPNPAVYTNSGAITINDHTPAFPYPSSVRVSCVPRPITRATVTLRGFTHAYPDDVDVLLAGPDGQSVILMSDAGDGSLANNINITLDDSAASLLPDSTQLFSGTFRPANYEDELDAFALPAPKLPYADSLSALAGTAANGFWSLFVVDDFQLDGGTLNNGWVLRLYWETTPMRLSEPRMLPNGGCQMTVTGEAQNTYTIEASTDLRTWSPIATITLSGTQADFTDPNPAPVRFYRATQP
jgi:subtilisin-like proprotein convertase family protein